MLIKVLMKQRNSVANYKNSPKLSPKCDCMKGILLFGKEKLVIISEEEFVYKGLTRAKFGKQQYCDNNRSMNIRGIRELYKDCNSNQVIQIGHNIVNHTRFLEPILIMIKEKRNGNAIQNTR
ncbi:Uncharacterised protein r2_g987 [Pycnogonum litorale]